MRRRFRRNYRYIKPFLVFMLLIMVAGVSYAYLSTTLNISGTARGINTGDGYIITSDSNPNLDIENFSINKWQEGEIIKSQFTFDIVNIGNTTYDNFIITINFNTDISGADVWDYEYSLSNDILTITNNKYNLKKNKSLRVGFIVSSTSSYTKIDTIKLDVDEEGNQIDLDEFKVVFTKTGEWGNYTYQYDVTVTNNTGVKINAWQIEIILPEGTTYENSWNVNHDVSGTNLILTNASYNGRLKNGESTTFGLQLQTDIINFIPSNVKATVR